MPQLSSERNINKGKGTNGEELEVPLATVPLGKSFSQQSNLKNGVLRKSGEPRTSLTGQFQFRKKKEKSTAILVSIVVLFILCHSYRLSLKIYEFAKPSSHVMDSFTFCYQQQR